MPKKTLFISRAFPPITGGIENQNAGILKALKKVRDVDTIINTKGKKFLPLFLPYALIKLLIVAKKYDSVLIGDGVLAPLAALSKRFTPGPKYVSIIHGLDITYAHKDSLMGAIYRKCNIPALQKLDKLIMVGNYTIDEAVKVGISRDLCQFIPNGFDPGEFDQSFERKELERLIGKPLDGKKVILRIGRFVEHKGVPWFLSNVLPKLDANIVFVAAGGTVGKTLGDSDAYSKSAHIIQEQNLSDRAILLTDIPWRDIKLLYSTADLYVSPNIELPGSAEGFGINAIEAAASRCTVLAADLQGLKDAIIEGQNGFLLPPEHTDAWVAKIQATFSEHDAQAFGQRARDYTKQNYNWERIATLYDEALS